MGVTDLRIWIVVIWIVAVHSIGLNVEFESTPNPLSSRTSVGRISTRSGILFLSGTEKFGVDIVSEKNPTTVLQNFQKKNQNCLVLAFSNKVLTSCNDFAVNLQQWEVTTSGNVSLTDIASYKPALAQIESLAVRNDVVFSLTETMTAIADFSTGNSFDTYQPIMGGKYMSLSGSLLLVVAKTEFLTYDIIDPRSPQLIVRKSLSDCTAAHINSLTVFVATLNKGEGIVSIYDISSTPEVLLGQQKFPKEITTITVTGSRVIISHGNSISIYETLDDLINGKQSSVANLATTVRGIVVENNRLFTALDNEAFAMINIINNTVTSVPPVVVQGTPVPIVSKESQGSEWHHNSDGNETETSLTANTTFGDSEVLKIATISGYAAFGSIVLGTSGGMISRQVLMSRFTSCEDNTDSVPPFLMYPLGMDLFGNYWKSAILLNTALIVVSCIVFMIVHSVLTCVLKCCGYHRDAASVAMRYPACIVPGILVLLPSILEYSFLVLFKGGGSERLFALLGFLIAAFFSYLFLTYGATDYARCAYVRDETAKSPVREYFLGSSCWVTTDGSQYVECSGIIFDNFVFIRRLNGNYYFLEFCQILPISLLAAIDGFCLGRTIIVMTLLLCQLLVMLKYPIFTSSFLRHITGLVLCCTIAALAASLGNQADGNNGGEVSNLLMKISLILSIARVSYDVISIISELVLGWKKRVGEDYQKITPHVIVDSPDDEISLAHLQYSSYDSSPEQSFSQAERQHSSSFYMKNPPKPIITNPNILSASTKHFPDSVSNSFALRSPLFSGRSEEFNYIHTEVTTCETDIVL